MHISCPRCHNAIEIVEDSSFWDVECPSCGSHFNLVESDTRPFALDCPVPAPKPTRNRSVWFSVDSEGCQPIGMKRTPTTVFTVRPSGHCSRRFLRRCVGVLSSLSSPTCSSLVNRATIDDGFSLPGR